MSDLNLPTTEITREAASFIVRHDVGSASFSFEMRNWSPQPGTYVLVPEEQMEQVWWCEQHDVPGNLGRHRKNCRWVKKWLVSAEGAER